jgi:hypothetical protein
MVAGAKQRNETDLNHTSARRMLSSIGQLGHSGLRVSEAALGTMTFGDDWGWGAAKIAWGGALKTLRAKQAQAQSAQ